MKPFTIVGISGSLRLGSYNSSLLRVAQHYASAQGMSVDILDIGSLPLFNQDHERDAHEAVMQLKQKIKGADGILFVTPEYNYSISGSLKNAIEWGTRPYGDNSFDGKPAGIMSVSTGILGGARAQYHLRQILVSPNVHVMNHPEIMVGQAKEKFNEVGELIDVQTQERVKEFLEAFAQWMGKFAQ
ncbi:MAG: NADPH-dependent FMN reductase [Candidatus Paceibacterota bacterium]|jgi:chromate reductase